jgi:uncharacterized zinc-type alcohol dehydrogenase-like protein
LGAFDFALTSQPETFTRLQRHFDFILDTVSAPHNYNTYVNLLKTDGTMILVEAPDKPTPLEPFPLILNRWVGNRGHPRNPRNARLLRHAQHRVRY